MHFLLKKTLIVCLKVKAAGFDTYMIQVDGMYKIQVGAYSKKENADAMANKLKAAGFDTFITTHGVRRCQLLQHLQGKSPLVVP